MVVTPAVLEVLQNIYGDVLFKHQGHTYPAIVHRAPPGCQPDDLLGTLTPHTATRADFALYDEAHLAERRASRHISNGLCYDATRLHLNPLKLDAHLGRYFDMVATCDALDHELRDFNGFIPLRDALHRTISPQDALLDCRGRSATVGAAVLTVFNDGSTYQAIVAHRAANLAVGAGMFHVVPAFVVQPIVDAQAEWSLQLQILREYGEELFAMPEHDALDSAPTTPDYFLTNPHIQALTSMFTDGRAELHATGIVLNLLSMRFELCSLLLIHDADWYRRNRAILESALDVERQGTYITPIESLAGLPDDWPERFTPQGVAALILGKETAVNLLK